MSHDTGHTCVCRSEHIPAPLELERHHVWPLGMGGPNVEANIIWICPTTHTNIHELLAHFIKSGRVWSWPETTAAYEQPVSTYAYKWAVEGYSRATAALTSSNT